MKNVKLLFWFILLISIANTSCKKDSEFLYDGDFQEEEQVIDSGNPTENNNNQTNEYGALTLYKIVNGEIIKVKDFNVTSNLVPFQQDVNKHQQMWDFFKRLIPEKDRQYITEFEVFHGDNSLAGYVAPINNNDLSKWKMGLAIDIAGDLGSIDLGNEFTYTAIHEFGHVLTLNHTQITVGQNNCQNFELQEGCSKSDSYVNRIFELGWEDIYSEFQKVNTEDEAYAFYEKYADRFVTDYAASNPAEDVAEVFSVFVTKDAPPSGNSIADQKVQLMYQYPELVSLRNEIRTQPALRALKAGSWVKRGKKRKCNHTVTKKGSTFTQH